MVKDFRPNLYDLGCRVKRLRLKVYDLGCSVYLDFEVEGFRVSGANVRA